jgi:hypothetical protein
MISHPLASPTKQIQRLQLLWLLLILSLLTACHTPTAPPYRPYQPVSWFFIIGLATCPKPSWIALPPSMGLR